MKNRNFKSIFIVSFFLMLTAPRSYALNRIRSVIFDKGQVTRISMVPGLATLVLFPCEINEAVVGRGEDLKVLVSPTSKRQLSVSLSTSLSKPTNILVRCGDKQDPFVFDVISNFSNHQDVLKVRGYVGSPEIEDSNLKLIDSSSRAVRRLPNSSSKKSVVLRAPELIEEAR